MIKRFALALVFTLIASACFATCTAPVTGNNAAGAAQTFNIYSDPSGNCNTVVAPSAATFTLTGWTSATALNTTQTLVATPHGAPALLLQLDQTSTITGGAITIEGTYDNVPNWVTIPVAQVVNPNTFASLTNPYTLVATTNQPFLILTQGYNQVRIRLSTVIAGTATVTPYVTLLGHNPILDAIYTAVSSSLPAGTNPLGNVGGPISSPVPSIGPYTAGQARSSEATAATNGNLVGLSAGLEGKLISLPFSNKENMVRGTASSAVNTAVTLIAAQGASNKIYVTGLQCYRNDAGTTAITVTLNDTETTGSGTEVVLPNGGGGGGTNVAFNTPLNVAANTALTFTVGTATTTVFCNAQGYFGT